MKKLHLLLIACFTVILFVDCFLNGVNSTQEYHLPQYILINLPIGGGWPGPPGATTVLPATLYCDYVRVYTTGG